MSGSDAAFRGGSRPSEMRASPVRARAAAGRTTRHRDCSEDGPDLTQGVAHGPLVARQYPGARRQYPAASCVSRRAIRVSSPWLTGRQYMRQYLAAPGPTLVVAPSESDPSQFPLAHGPSVPRMSECVSAPAGRSAPQQVDATSENVHQGHRPIVPLKRIPSVRLPSIHSVDEPAHGPDTSRHVQLTWCWF